MYCGLQINPKTTASAGSINTVDAAVVNSTPPVASTFVRGFVETQGIPCANDQGGRFKSENVSRAETVAMYAKLGLPDGLHDKMAAISHAESGGLISCLGDDYAPYYMAKVLDSKGVWHGEHWKYSIGLYQIRVIVEREGDGSCRDELRLKDNLEEQTRCMWEISGEGKSFSPWSVTHANRGKPYLAWLGKDW